MVAEPGSEMPVFSGRTAEIGPMGTVAIQHVPQAQPATDLRCFDSQRPSPDNSPGGQEAQNMAVDNTPPRDSLQLRLIQEAESRMAEQTMCDVINGRPATPSATAGSTPPRTMAGSAVAAMADNIGEATLVALDKGSQALAPAAGLLAGGAAGWSTGACIGNQLAVATGQTGGLGVTQASYQITGGAIGAALVGAGAAMAGTEVAVSPLCRRRSSRSPVRPATHDMAALDVSPIQPVSERHSLEASLVRRSTEDMEWYKNQTKEMARTQDKIMEILGGIDYHLKSQDQRSAVMQQTIGNVQAAMAAAQGQGPHAYTGNVLPSGGALTAAAVSMTPKVGEPLPVGQAFKHAAPVSSYQLSKTFEYKVEVGFDKLTAGQKNSILIATHNVIKAKPSNAGLEQRRVFF